jgi:hypothetical protein
LNIEFLNLVEKGLTYLCLLHIDIIVSLR